MIPKMLASRSAHGGLTLHIGLLPIKREWVRQVRPILTRVITSSLLEMSGVGRGINVLLLLYSRTCIIIFTVIEFSRSTDPAGVDGRGYLPLHRGRVVMKRRPRPYR